MIYGYATRYFTQSHMLFFEQLPDAIRQYAEKLDLTRLKRNNSGNIFLTGPVSGFDCAILLSNVLKADGYRVGCFFPTARDLWAGDIRKMIYVNGSPLSKEDFLIHANAFRDLLSEMEPDIEQPLSPGARRLLFAGYVFTRLRCQICILDETLYDPSDRETPFSSSLFSPVFTIVTGPGPSQSQDLSFPDRCLSASINGSTQVVVSNLQQFFQSISKICSQYNCQKRDTAKAQFLTDSHKVQATRFTYRGNGPFTVKALSQSAWQDCMAVWDLLQAMNANGYQTDPAHFEQALPESHFLCGMTPLSVSPYVFLSRCYSSGDALLLRKTLHFMVEHDIISGDILVLCGPGASRYPALSSDEISCRTEAFPSMDHCSTPAQVMHASANALSDVLTRHPNTVIVCAGDLNYLTLVEKAYHHIKR